MRIININIDYKEFVNNYLKHEDLSKQGWDFTVLTADSEYYVSMM